MSAAARRAGVGPRPIGRDGTMTMQAAMTVRELYDLLGVLMQERGVAPGTPVLMLQRIPEESSFREVGPVMDVGVHPQLGFVALTDWLGGEDTAHA